MDLFRRKQKYIFWIVTIIIVPSFVLVWGVSGSPSGGGDPTLATVNGKSLSFTDYQNFRQRLQAAVGESPLMVMGAPENEAVPGLWNFLWAYFLIDEAQKAGVGASDALVGTYLRNQHPVIAPQYRENPDKLDEAVNSLCLRMQISRTEFLRGVREWLTLVNYVELDNGAIVPDKDSAYAFYALDRAEFDFKRIRVTPTDDIRDQARRDVMERPADELEPEIRAHIAANQTDPRFRAPAKWRFAYILMPFSSSGGAAVPPETEVEAYYNANRSTRYADKALGEVREAVLADIANDERERQTLRNLTVDVDSQLRAHSDMPVEELAKLTQLVKYGVKAGETGSEPRTAVELATGSEFAPAGQLVEFLDLFDRIPAEERAREIENWKAGFLITPNPLRTEKGYVRLRLLDFEPSVLMDVEGDDGKIKPELFEAALSDLIAARVGELTREKAEEMERQISAVLEAKASGGEYSEEIAAQLDELPAESRIYRQLVGTDDYLFGRMGVGEVRGPLIVQGEAGAPSMSWDVLVLTERRVPSLETFMNESEAVKTEYSNKMKENRGGRIGYSIAGNSLVQAIQPSEGMTVSFWNKIAGNQITVNQELLNPQS